jgi:putative tryptophan/tyrosine transport system substrate-binding protein
MQFDQLKRRDFIALIGAAAAWPFAARAQPAMPVIGFMSGRSPDAAVSDLVATFRQELNNAGHVVDRNVAIEYRWAANQVDRLPAFATELVSRRVSVIAAFGTVPAQAAQAASTTIPIVFMTADDPVSVPLSRMRKIRTRPAPRTLSPMVGEVVADHSPVFRS